MIQNILGGIKNVDTFPVISLLLFLSVFIGVLVWVFRMKKDYIDHMEQLPILNDEAIIHKGNDNE